MPEKLLTIFTAPKPFKDAHTSTIQRNALRSWQALGEVVDILVLGGDEGIAENTKNIGITHILDVLCNEKGTPLVSSMLNIAREKSSSPFLAIVNADIILFQDLLDAIQIVSDVFKSFILIGQRWDMDIEKELPSGSAAFSRLKERVSTSGMLHPPMGSDYFVFPRDCYLEIPDFAIGRAGWDNWFIFKSRWEGWSVVDATDDVTIIHQNHDYRHLSGGKPHYRLPETRTNVERAGGEYSIFTMFDAQFHLRNGSLKKKKKNLRKIIREIEIFPLTNLRSKFLGQLFYYSFRPKKAYALICRVIGSARKSNNN